MSGQVGFWGTGAPDDPVEYGHRALDIAVRRHDPVAVFAMFSGGHDSLCSTHFAAQHPAFTAAVHINTGIGIPQTRRFVRKTCEEQGWPLLEYRAVDEGQHYDEIVMEHGFPGPGQHTKMYNRLKERALRSLVRDHKSAWKDGVLLVTGVRRSESTRRMGTVETINRQGAQVWVAPLAWWTDAHKARYMAEHYLPRNEVVDLLHMSGECLCGAFAKPGEKDWIAEWFPEVAARIETLEVCAREKGVHSTWGTRPSTDSNDPKQGDFAPLCVGCAEKIEAA